MVQKINLPCYLWGNNATLKKKTSLCYVNFKMLKTGNVQAQFSFYVWFL